MATPYFTRTSSGTEGSASTTNDIALCQLWRNTLMHGAASSLGETAMHSRLRSHAWMHAMHHMGDASLACETCASQFPQLFLLQRSCMQKLFQKFQEVQKKSDTYLKNFKGGNFQ